MISYPALFEPDTGKGGFVVTFPDLNHGATQGETQEEAMEMAEDFLLCVAGDYLKEEKALPAPGKYRGRKYRLVQLPMLATMKVELYRAFRASGMRKAELARRLGMSKGNIERLFNLNHQSRLDQIEAAFEAVGKKLTVLIEAA
jgi:antitoxin HicB